MCLSNEQVEHRQSLYFLCFRAEIWRLVIFDSLYGTFMNIKFISHVVVAV